MEDISNSELFIVYILNTTIKVYSVRTQGYTLYVPMGILYGYRGILYVPRGRLYGYRGILYGYRGILYGLQWYGVIKMKSCITNNNLRKQLRYNNN
jgi:hypothetical protein